VGGCGIFQGRRTALGDTWFLNLKTNEWEEGDADAVPPPRYLHTLTFDDFMNQLHVSGTALHASLDALQEEQAIIIHIPTQSPQIHRVEITLEGRIRAQPLSSWTDLLIRFVDHATPTALNELHHGLLASLSRRRNTIDISALCLTCRYFAPFRYPHDPIQPHHCHLIEEPMLDRQLRTSCQGQPISTKA
jgi:hypothetical protein